MINIFVCIFKKTKGLSAINRTLADAREEVSGNTFNSNQ